MKNYVILLLVLFSLLGEKAYTQWFFPEEGKASIFVKSGYYPQNSSWQYKTQPFLQGAIKWDEINGKYKACFFAEFGLELARPYWSIQLNFGIKQEEIYVKNTDFTYKFNSNYFTSSLLLFPFKHDQTLIPFLMAKAGINFQSEHIQDNARLLAYGIGIRSYLKSRLGCEFIIEKQSINYKRIHFGQGIKRHFNVRPFRLSFGLFYDI